MMPLFQQGSPFSLLKNCYQTEPWVKCSTGCNYGKWVWWSTIDFPTIKTLLSRFKYDQQTCPIFKHKICLKKYKTFFLKNFNFFEIFAIPFEIQNLSISITDRFLFRYLNCSVVVQLVCSGYTCKSLLVPDQSQPSFGQWSCNAIISRFVKISGLTWRQGINNKVTTISFYFDFKQCRQLKFTQSHNITYILLSQMGPIRWTSWVRRTEIVKKKMASKWYP